LGAIVVTQAALVGVAVGMFVVAIGAESVVGWASGIGVAGVMLWRSRRVWSLAHAALWVEERDPGLQYQLVTAVDPSYAGWPAPMYSGPLLRRAAVRAIGPAVVGLGVVVVVSHLLAVHHVRIVGPRSIGGRDTRTSGAVANRLTPLSAHVVPPAYSRLPTQDLKEPSSIATLVGSAVVLRGSGDANGVRAELRSTSGSLGALTANGDGDGWRVALTMPSTPGLVKLSDGVHERLVVLAPIPDAPPVVELTAPARDSVMREAHGTLSLEAKASDDLGLASGEFEIIVSSGSEDEGGVHGSTQTVGRVAFGDVRTGTLRGGFALDSLKPGEIVSIRAIVRDGNTVSGPGIGTSETRTYRVATKEEYDSIAVEGAPPPGIDSSYMSQRMIVIATRALLGRMSGRHPVPRDTVVAASRKLGAREDELKYKVQRILRGGERGEGEAMSAEERVQFDTALASMTDASMSLAIAEPKEALPRELVALAALDSVRKMQHRLYLRGKPPTIVVNLGRVRMHGTSKPAAGPWTAEVGSARDSVRRRLRIGLEEIVGGAQTSGRGKMGRPGLADSLTILQVDALTIDPTLAGVLGEAVSAVRGGADPGPALSRARRMLNGAATADTSRSGWVGS
jgi:hypothetical protein